MVSVSAVTFANKDDYQKIKENDLFDIIGLTQFAPGKQLKLRIIHFDGSNEEILLNHTYNETQIEWFKAGSALNLIKKQTIK